MLNSSLRSLEDPSRNWQCRMLALLGLEMGRVSPVHVRDHCQVQGGRSKRPYPLRHFWRSVPQLQKQSGENSKQGRIADQWSAILWGRVEDRDLGFEEQQLLCVSAGWVGTTTVHVQGDKSKEGNGRKGIDVAETAGVLVRLCLKGRRWQSMIFCFLK